MQPLTNTFKNVFQDGEAGSQLFMFALNSVILAGKLTERIPKEITQACFAFFPLQGMLLFPDSCRELAMRVTDLTAAIKTRKPEAILFTALKVATKATDILLGFGALVAALCPFVGFTNVALYAFMRPVGIGSVLTEIAVSFLDNDPERRLDYKTRSALGPSPSKKPLEKAKRLSDDKRITDVALKTLGHVALLVYRAYPDTLLQAATSWGISLLYTANAIYIVHNRNNLKPA